MAANTHMIYRIWAEEDVICGELLYDTIFVPELSLALDPRQRTIEDWFNECFQEDFASNTEMFIPSELNVTEEPQIVEVIGVYSVRSDGSGEEYEEISSFNITSWTAMKDEGE